MKTDSKIVFRLVALASALPCAAATSAWADWTPPESSVTPPAVLTLDAFTAPDWNGRNPSAPLVVGPDRALYGSARYGGSSGDGTLFRLATDGTFTKLHDFTATTFLLQTSGGANPDAALVVGPDGALYGSTPEVWLSDWPWIGWLLSGTLFRVETNGVFTTLHEFNGTGDFNPSGALVVGPDGALYGSTSGGGTNNGNGTLFRLETNGTFTKLHDFNYTDGAGPSAALVAGPDGALYGSTSCGGTSGYGTLFRLGTEGTFTKLHDFDGANGGYPSAALVVGPDGAMYGSTPRVWNEDWTVLSYGTLFRLATDGAFTTLHDFDLTDGASPYAPLVVGPDAALYGSTQFGGISNCGALFRLESNGAFTKLHDFGGTDGRNPFTALAVGPDGALYGCSPEISDSYPDSHGTLFRLATDGTFTNFNYTYGAGPSAALVAAPDGGLYGSTQDGGSGIRGTLFRLGTDGTFTTLHDLDAIGAGPSAALVVGPNGALYGSTPDTWVRMGPFGPIDPRLLSYGTLFRLEANGSFTMLHGFSSADGYGPAGALVVGQDGALYGVTDGDQSYQHEGWGTLFRLETNGTFTKLHDFNGTNGGNPSAALVLGPEGALYGSTPAIWELDPSLRWRLLSYGTLFRLETDGTFTKLHDFSGVDGYGSSAVLVVGPDGALYGSTPEIWSRGLVQPSLLSYGTLFRLEINGAFTELHEFNGTDGRNPSAPLVVGPDGALYGSTQDGGSNTNEYGYGYGTLFRLETNGSFSKLHNFNGTDGMDPSAALVVGPDGALYGSTKRGGASGGGTLFRLGTDGTFTKLCDFNWTNGANPTAALVMGADGALYGSTPSGGPRGGGILFKLVLDRPPVADASATPGLVISRNGLDASVLLDGSRSSDPDGDPLQYFWLLVAPKLSEGGSTLNSQPSTLLATDVVAVAVLPVGSHIIQLVVNDGTLSDTNSVRIEVITTTRAVGLLASTVDSEVPKPHPLLATLAAAMGSLERDNGISAMKQLRAFQKQAQAQVGPLNAGLEASLVQLAQQIIDALTSLERARESSALPHRRTVRADWHI